MDEGKWERVAARIWKKGDKKQNVIFFLGNQMNLTPVRNSLAIGVAWVSSCTITTWCLNRQTPFSLSSIVGYNSGFVDNRKDTIPYGYGDVNGLPDDVNLAVRPKNIQPANRSQTRR